MNYFPKVFVKEPKDVHVDLFTGHDLLGDVEHLLVLPLDRGQVVLLR